MSTRGPQHLLRAQSPDAADDTSGCIEFAPVGWVGLLASDRPAEGMKQTIECSQRKAAFPWRGLTAQWRHARRGDEASVRLNVDVANHNAMAKRQGSSPLCYPNSRDAWSGAQSPPKIAFELLMAGRKATMPIPLDPELRRRLV